MYDHNVDTMQNTTIRKSLRESRICGGNLSRIPITLPLRQVPPDFYGNHTCLGSIQFTDMTAVDAVLQKTAPASTSARDHAQQCARPAHPDIVEGTQGVAMSRPRHIDKNNYLALKAFEIPNLCKADGMTIPVTR